MSASSPLGRIAAASFPASLGSQGLGQGCVQGSALTAPSSLCQQWWGDPRHPRIDGLRPFSPAPMWSSVPFTGGRACIFIGNTPSTRSRASCSPSEHGCAGRSLESLRHLCSSPARSGSSSKIRFRRLGGRLPTGPAGLSWFWMVLPSPPAPHRQDAPAVPSAPGCSRGTKLGFLLCVGGASPQPTLASVSLNVDSDMPFMHGFITGHCDSPVLPPPPPPVLVLTRILQWPMGALKCPGVSLLTGLGWGLW